MENDHGSEFTGGSGNIRCITAGPENQWVAIGHSSGMVSVLDLRSGIVMGTWNAHEGEILQIKARTVHKI